MASIINRPNGHRWIQFTFQDARKTVRLGQVPLKVAEEVSRRIVAILAARKHDVAIDAESLGWLGRIDDEVHKRIAATGLIEDRQSAKLGPFLEEFISSRGNKERTQTNDRNGAARLTEYFGAETDLRTITAADADRWYAWLCGGYADTTRGRTVKRAKMFFRAAVRRKLVAENPFSHLKSTGKIDKSRQAYIDRESAFKILDACPNLHWRLIFALARFAGFRVPSDICELTWPSVFWDEGTIHLLSTKTGFRVIPIAPELRPYLEQAWDEAKEGAVKVVEGVEYGSNLATTMVKIVMRAGIKPWPKTFVNLRASCQTDWMNKFPIHIVCSWLGNSPQVALEHYARVTEEDHQRLARSEVITNADEQDAGKRSKIESIGSDLRSDN